VAFLVQAKLLPAYLGLENYFLRELFKTIEERNFM